MNPASVRDAWQRRLFLARLLVVLVGVFGVFARQDLYQLHSNDCWPRVHLVEPRREIGPIQRDQEDDGRVDVIGMNLLALILALKKSESE